MPIEDELRSVRPLVLLGETIRLKGEEVAEFDYRPVACRKFHRAVVLHKRMSVEKGQLVLFEEYRFFFSRPISRDVAPLGGGGNLRKQGLDRLEPGCETIEHL